MRSLAGRLFFCFSWRLVPEDGSNDSSQSFARASPQVFRIVTVPTFRHGREVLEGPSIKAPH
jgi:hypothetical protein